MRKAMFVQKESVKSSVKQKSVKKTPGKKVPGKKVSVQTAFVQKFWLRLSAAVLSGTSATSLGVAGWVSLMGTTAIATSVTTTVTTAVTTSVTTTLLSSTLIAPTAAAATVSSWQFDPATNQLDLVLPDGVTPRYFLVAEPARIVVDLANTEFDSTATQRTYPGAIAEIQVGQFQPGITRIVLRLAPGTVLAPGQVDLQQVSSSGGATRWVLRPLLADTTESNMATQPAPTQSIAPAPATTPALPAATATQPAPTQPTVRVPEESTAQAAGESQREARARERAERRAQEQARREQTQQQRQARREQARVQAEQERQARQQRSQPGADSFPSPNLAQAPTPTAPSPQAQALPPATFANPQLPTVVVPGSGDFRAARPAGQAATGSGSLPTTPLSPPTNDVALTPPANNPVVFQSTTRSTAQSTAQSTVRQQPTLIAAAQIIDFGQPLPLPGRPLPPSNGGGGVIGVGDVLVPSGTTLNLRYEGQDPLDIFPSDSFEAVLSLDEEVRDRSGFTVFPRGSSVVGRFVSNDAGEAQFVAQTISFSGRSFTFRAESGTIAGERQVDRRNLLRNSAIGAAAGIGLSAITGVGILPAILGGAAAGAAGTYSNSPAEPPVIQPNQVIEVRTIDDVLR